MDTFEKYCRYEALMTSRKQRLQAISDRKLKYLFLFCQMVRDD